VRFHFIFSAVIAFVAATMLTKCGNSSVVWEHYDQCALENPSFLAMAECGRRKRLAACEPNNTCSPEGTMFMQYVDSLVLLVKKKELTEAEAMRRYTEYKSGTVAPVGSGGLGARQVALSCDPIIFFEGVPDLVLKFTIFRSGQSFCDLVRSWYRVDPASTRNIPAARS